MSADEYHKTSVAPLLEKLEAELNEQRQTIEHVHQEWWHVATRLELERMEREELERDLQAARDALVEAEQKITGQQHTISRLLLKSGSAPPPKWLLRSARKARRGELAMSDLEPLAKKCLRWAENHIIRNSGGEKDEVLEDVGL